MKNAGAPLNGFPYRAAGVIWERDRRRWLTIGEDVAVLIGSQITDRSNVTSITDAEIAAVMEA